MNAVAEIFNSMAQDDKLKRVLADSTYDYRLAYLRGEEPQINESDKKYHWGSKTKKGEWLKSPDHFTAWKEVFFNLTGFNPDNIPAMTKEDADKILVKGGHKPVKEYLPKEWKPTQLDPKQEKAFQEWMKGLKWFKEID